ncbi:hypothetical protein SLS60_005445 [Paraconiothyrium brasiliense]|uniref:Restriction of telomere capping protein 4 n=1 Tax=Paraconiothyrium brasiliense TaxID=300254 RepID=A0ABR3RI20_9PLEO
MEADLDIHADPISSGDENNAPPQPSLSQSSNASTRTNARTTAKVTSSAPRKTQKVQPIRAPKRGAFRQGLACKVNFTEQDKENSQEGPSSSSGRRETAETVYFGMGDTPRKKQKTKNVHAVPVGFNKKSFGKDKPNTSSSIPKKSDFSHVHDLDNALSNMLDKHEQYADISDDEIPSPATKRRRIIQRLPAGYATSSNPTMKDSQTTAPSSPLTSIPDHDEEELNVIGRDLAHHSRQDEDSVCALCQDEVDPEEQQGFWAEHSNKTVRNQMLFCKEHKRSQAKKDFREQGFPEIEWLSLPCRIRSFRSDLIALLRNETEEESVYRTKHAERLVSGKAAALPSKRRGQKAQAAEQEMLDIVDTTSSSTGYYGPRGKRIMMEVITADLSDVIREVAAKDPVVGRSGFAMFLQAVLVPELTLLLVMDDMQVDKETAQKLVDQSGELGTSLHEEIEDEVRLISEDEEEEEDY